MYKSLILVLNLHGVLFLNYSDSHFRKFRVLSIVVRKYNLAIFSMYILEIV